VACIATKKDALGPLGVKMRKPRNEHMSAGLRPKADIARRGWHGRSAEKL
jgi:hypothetical protein